MADPLSLDTYVIARPTGFSLNVPYDIYDNQGTKLFDVKRAFIGEVYSLIDPSKKVVGTITRKMIAITPSYELRDANKATIGKAIEEINLAGSIMGGSKNFALQDASGSQIARVKLTQPLAVLFDVLQGKPANMSSEITSPEGEKTLGKVGVVKSMDYSSFASKLSRSSSFVLQITDKGVSKLALLEFAIAVDHLYSSGSTRPGGISFGSGGFSGPGGFGGGTMGGGMNIKL